MKLKDPRLAALVSSYRVEVRPSDVERDMMWERLAAQTQPQPRWSRRTLVVAIAAAAAVLLAAWVGLRAIGSRDAESSESESRSQAVYGAAGSQNPQEAARGTPSRASAAGATPVERPQAAIEATTSVAAVPPATTSVAAVPPATTSVAAVPPATTSVAAVPPATKSASAETADAGRSPGARVPPAQTTGGSADTAGDSDNASTDNASTGEPDALQLIERAESALRQGRAQDAMQTLTEHQRRFPNAATTEERRALRIVALCELGRVAQGRGALPAFLRDYPRSAYRDRVLRACPRP